MGAIQHSIVFSDNQHGRTNDFRNIDTGRTFRFWMPVNIKYVEHEPEIVDWHLSEYEVTETYENLQFNKPFQHETTRVQFPIYNVISSELENILDYTIPLDESRLGEMYDIELVVKTGNTSANLKTFEYHYIGSLSDKGTATEMGLVKIDEYYSGEIYGDRSPYATAHLTSLPSAIDIIIPVAGWACDVMSSSLTVSKASRINEYSLWRQDVISAGRDLSKDEDNPVIRIYGNHVSTAEYEAFPIGRIYRTLPTTLGSKIEKIVFTGNEDWVKSSVTIYDDGGEKTVHYARLLLDRQIFSDYRSQYFSTTHTKINWVKFYAGSTDWHDYDSIAVLENADTVFLPDEENIYICVRLPEITEDTTSEDIKELFRGEYSSGHPFTMFYAGDRERIDTEFYPGYDKFNMMVYMPDGKRWKDDISVHVEYFEIENPSPDPDPTPDPDPVDPYDEDETIKSTYADDRNDMSYISQASKQDVVDVVYYKHMTGNSLARIYTVYGAEDYINQAKDEYDFIERQKVADSRLER